MPRPAALQDTTGVLILALRAGAGVLHVRNAHYNSAHACDAVARTLPRQAQQDAATEVRSWPDYQATPLFSLTGLAAAARVAEVWIKDEAPRFGLGSFKALGGAYAVGRLAGGASTSRTFVCATDGNHGRAVAWGAHRLGCRSVIFLHKGVSPGREAALRVLGAEIVRVAGNYDDSVRDAARAAAEKGWMLVGDTSDSDLDPAPALVMAGYTVLVDEIAAQLENHAQLTHIFVQSGVGGLAAAIIAGVCRYWPTRPPLIVTVEPDRAACVLHSVETARRVTVDGQLDTIMAGLACGEVSCTAWPMLKSGVAHALAIQDSIVPLAMRIMFRGVADDPRVVCGESGVAGIAALLAATGSAEIRASLGLRAESRILVINTEGATDPAIYSAHVPEMIDPEEESGAIRL